MEKTILIVEDHRDMMSILQKYLGEHQYKTIAAENAEIAIQLYQNEHPDLVLMDLMLPGMSGLEAIKKIKENISPKNYVPIIIITAKNEVSDIVTGLDVGADDYVVKPFHFDELMARIKTALRLKELNERLVQQSEELEEANTKISDLNRNLLNKNRELRKNIYNLHGLFEISIELNSILDLHRLVNSILLTIVGQFSSNSALFLLASKPEIDRLEIINSKGFYYEALADLIIEKTDPLISYFNKKGLPALVHRLRRKIKNSPALDQLSELDIRVVTPIVVKGTTEGLVCLGPRVKKRAYEKQDLEQISILANIIAISITNATLYKEVEQLSYTDGMTELHNFRYFDLRLHEEITRHKRNKTGLSLLILDVDNFKNFNDTMGHPAGDEVLRKLARILKETVRENDIVARYGGEEFAVILPQVEKDGAFILAERIRENIEKTYFEHEEIQPLGKVTVSIGGANLPDDADDYQSLVNRADMALYKAKNTGRNRVVIFNSEDQETNDQPDS